MTIAEIVEAVKLDDEQKNYDAAWSCVKILNDERIDDVIKVYTAPNLKLKDKSYSNFSKFRLVLFHIWSSSYPTAQIKTCN